MTSFWDSIRKSSNTRILLASMIDNCTGEENIAHMWQDHCNSLLNSVKGNSSKQVIHDKLGTIPSESKSILFTNSDLNSALKSLKRGKACGVDGLAAAHGHLPTDFMKTAITEIPVIKTTTDQSLWSLPHLNYLKFVYLKFYKCTLLHMITSLDLKQNTLLTCVFLL